MTLLLLTALTLGMVHTIAPDHLAAVSVFVSRRPGWRRAVAYGARWGLGHSITIVLVGVLVLLTQVRLPAAFESQVDRVVGLVLIWLGVQAVRRAWRGRAAVAHGHVAGEGAPAHAHDDGGKLLGIGMLHGLAGSGALVVALPSAAAASPAGSLGYLAAFGVGTIVAMSVLAAALGAAIHAAAAGASQRMERGAVVLAGLASVAVGCWWMVR
ncbi:MAG: sulfite exporter TauE/SafE family protein [Gemmatimonadaceae bacterium]|jgi:xanthosine utilization system XapX-like protein|nr:sulfite exporter TauE/SafE family protein [Gemmatimonadaceae bacterium]